MDRAITRDEAVELLFAMSDSGMFSEELSEKLADIANAIENEKYGLHLWGADNKEYGVLVTAVNEDVLTEEYAKEGQRIWDKYGFTPSPFEKEEIEQNIEEA